MPEAITCDICVIGAGSAGLSVAAGAAQLGARTVLFEKSEMGGDCLNTGCVPSKALLAAAHHAHVMRTGGPFGIQPCDPVIDFTGVMDHVRKVIAAIAPHDSVARFEGLGVRVVRAAARFTGACEVSGGGVSVRARRVVIATGSQPSIPPIQGIDTVDVLTNESVFSLEQRPGHLLIVGGGPIGIEMAQAFRRLGSAVTVMEGATILQKDEPELVDILRQTLIGEGVTLREGVKIARVTRNGDGVSVHLDGVEEPVTGTHLLVAAGRKLGLEGLGLDQAGIAFTAKGVTVDAGLRTSNRKVYAIGDVSGGPQFTHIAGYQAGIVLRNALFRLPARTDYRVLPWVTYCDPELAHIGLTEAEARKQFGEDVRIAKADFRDNDRARAERAITGGVKTILRGNGTIIGVSLLGSGAGEQAGLWALAISERKTLRDISGLVLPYPTRGEIAKAVASNFLYPKLFSVWPRRLVRLLLKLG
jgi:pyruvate/2-oxoglutarate dehydrogenase complex dihydrolipoamide dehydrogenase (E3) component